MGILGWTRSDIPDQRGRHAVITGGNSGIGFEVGRTLLDHGLSHLTLVSRNIRLLEDAAADLREEFPGASVSCIEVDLTDLSNVRAGAQQLLASGRPIHLLINMAGRYLDSPFQLTKDGFEATRASVYWGHVYWTMLLLPRILESEPARIVNMISVAESFAGPIRFDDLKGEQLRTSGAQAYATAKVMMLLFSQELQRRLRLTGKDVECFAVQPGLVATALGNKISLRYPFSWISVAGWLAYSQSPLQGAQSTLYAATEPSLKGKGGTFIGPQYSTWLFHSTIRTPRNPQAWLTHKNADTRARLWDDSVKLLHDLTGDVLPELPSMVQPLGRVHTDKSD